MTREQDRRQRSRMSLFASWIPGITTLVVGALALYISQRENHAVDAMRLDELSALPPRVRSLESEVGALKAIQQSNSEMLREIRADVKQVLRGQP
jgi:hypothetical protein